MAEHELELRLRAAARALDADAPAFDPAVLRAAPPHSGGRCSCSPPSPRWAS